MTKLQLIWFIVGITVVFYLCVSELKFKDLGVKIREVILKTYKIKRAGLFGSLIKDGFNENSDIDILVEIKSNINLGWDKITDDEIVSAAKTVGAHNFISKLPNGYDEEVMEKGATLSVGQKQLISFARALAYNPQILILDEATSSIDAYMELKIQKALNHLLRDRICFVAAHRLSTIQNADKILVLHKGKVTFHQSLPLPGQPGSNLVLQRKNRRTILHQTASG